MATVAVYTCGHCGGLVAKAATTCPHCYVSLVGIQCHECHFSGGVSDFVGDRCPRCGSIVYTGPSIVATGPKPKERRLPGQKSPAAHGWASAAIPGLGTMLCGNTRRGLLILGLSVLMLFGVTAVIAGLAGSGAPPVGSWLALPIWVWGIVDGYRSAQQWNLAHPPLAQAAASAPAAPPVVPTGNMPPLASLPAAPPASDVHITFDKAGKVSMVDVPQGRWTTTTKGDATFHAQRGPTLLYAAETLKKLGDIPGLTYYVVETLDGSLGRDVFGFYTETPIKAFGLAPGSTVGVDTSVEMGRLSASGDQMKQASTIANIRSVGKYACLVLMMECGRCGYESPVETEPGPLSRQCYCCGASNTGSRGSITVMVAPDHVVEI
jgi:hypothetical protein